MKDLRQQGQVLGKLVESIEQELRSQLDKTLKLPLLPVCGSLGHKHPRGADGGDVPHSCEVVDRCEGLRHLRNAITEALDTLAGPFLRSRDLLHSLRDSDAIKPASCLDVLGGFGTSVVPPSVWPAPERLCKPLTPGYYADGQCIAPKTALVGSLFLQSDTVQDVGLCVHFAKCLAATDIQDEFVDYQVTHVFSSKGIFWLPPLKARAHWSPCRPPDVWLRPLQKAGSCNHKDNFALVLPKFLDSGPSTTQRFTLLEQAMTSHWPFALLLPVIDQFHWDDVKAGDTTNPDCAAQRAIKAMSIATINLLHQNPVLRVAILEPMMRQLQTETIHPDVLEECECFSHLKELGYMF